MSAFSSCKREFIFPWLLLGQTEFRVKTRDYSRELLGQLMESMFFKFWYLYQGKFSKFEFCNEQ